LFETGTLVRDREGTLFKVLFIDEGRIVMKKRGTDPDVFSTRTVALEDFEKYGYSVVKD